MSNALHYVSDDTNPFLLMCTIQRSETAPRLAKLLHKKGIRAYEDEEDSYKVFNGFNEMASMTVMDFVNFVHDNCPEIFQEDNFFVEDRQDNQMRLFRTCEFLAKMSAEM